VIGWFIAGMAIGQAKKKQDEKKAKALEERRAREPHPVMAWVVFSAFAVSMVIGGGAGVLPFVVGMAVAVWVYEGKRRTEHDEWLRERAAEQAEFDADNGMPASAHVLKDFGKRPN
jgi:ABC-type Fe3+ transport system permease subunit